MPSRDSGRATLVDVARASQVSRQTVSNVVNNPHRVAPETLLRVQAHIDRLDFHPNRAARSLRRRRANAVGFQVETPAQRGFSNILDPFLIALTECAQRGDAHVITFVSEDSDLVGTYRRLLSTQVVDGFVLSHTRPRDPRAAWLSDQQVPYVSFGRIWGVPQITSWVDVDGRAGTGAAVRHLHNLGYRRCAWFGWAPGSPVGDDRRLGWERACAELDIDCTGLAATTGHDLHEALTAADALLERLSPGDAVVCVSDVAAVAVSTALTVRGLRPGADVGVVGFDDGELARGFGLTTISQPLALIAELLVRMLHDREPPRHGVLITPRLVERSSTAPQAATGAARQRSGRSGRPRSGTSPQPRRRRAPAPGPAGE